MYSINPSFLTNHKPNDSLILLNLCWQMSFPFMKQCKTQHRFPPRSAPGFVWFQSFPRRGIPQRVAYCRVCLETWMMCHQSSWRIVSHVFFYNPIIQIWLTHRSRIWIPTQVVDASQDWDFGKSTFCFQTHDGSSWGCHIQILQWYLWHLMVYLVFNQQANVSWWAL